MTDYFGNYEPLSGTGSWRVGLQVVDNGGSTNPTTRVYYAFFLEFTGNVNDVGNVIRWTDPWDSGNFDNFSFIGGPGRYQLGPAKYRDAPIHYGGGGDLHFTISASGIGMSSRASTLDIMYPMPGRSGSVPQAPGPVHVHDLKPTSASLVLVPPAPTDTGGYPIEDYEVIVTTSNTSNPIAGAGGNIHAMSNGSFVVTIQPEVRYYATSRARNALGWSAWSPYVPFITVPAAIKVMWYSVIRQRDEWRDAMVYVNVNGVWKVAIPFARHLVRWKRVGINNPFS